MSKQTYYNVTVCGEEHDNVTRKDISRIVEALGYDPRSEVKYRRDGFVDVLGLRSAGFRVVGPINSEPAGYYLPAPGADDAPLDASRPGSVMHRLTGI